MLDRVDDRRQYSVTNFMTLHDTSVPHKTHALQHAHSTRSRALTVHVSRHAPSYVKHTTRPLPLSSRVRHGPDRRDGRRSTPNTRPLSSPRARHPHPTRCPSALPYTLVAQATRTPLWDRALWALGKHSSTLDRWQASQRRRCHHPPASRLSSPASPAHRGSFSPRRPRLTDASHNRQPHAPTRARATTVQEAAAHPRAPAHACPRQAPDLSRMISAAHEPSAGRHPEARRPPPPS